MNFSEKNQSFYEKKLNYHELPDDLVEVTPEQHKELLNAINSGYYVFSNLSLSSQKKPSQFHEWNGTEWIDPRTPEEISAYDRALLPKLSKRQFALYLYDNEMYDDVMQAINANPRFKIEYDSVSDIERLSPTVAEMSVLLGWDDDQVDEMWEQALTL